MTMAIRRGLRIYGAIAAVVPKEHLAYNLWFWAEFILQIVAMVIYVYFWRAVYAGNATVGGLTLDQTLNYILLARILAPAIETRLIFHFGFLVGMGQVAVELTRPLDLQVRYYVENVTGLAMFLLLKLPLLVIAIVFFGLRLPADPAAWGACLVSLLLGYSAVFLFDWIFACLAFYTTETWGLSVVRVSVAQFFSGAWVPLAMMPGWLQQIAAGLPFAQAMAVPLSFLSGVASPAEAPGIWLVQLAWVLGLGLLSRLAFNVAVRKVTVQGG
jgi:ABC-2 type transport system permease protein